MNRWIPVGGTIASGDDEPSECWTATAIDGWEPAFHPVFDFEAEAAELCDALNALDWTEDDFFDNAREIMKAHENGTLAALVAKRITRGFWRGFIESTRRIFAGKES